ncbi:hypothetical protein M0802_014817 [Mischocyttarus mexicanus]|nr:hypothetical protein M0802_014817 [Mischocyttarus mexicanus]
MMMTKKKEKRVSKALIGKINSAKRGIKKVTPATKEELRSCYLALSSLRRKDLIVSFRVSTPTPFSLFLLSPFPTLSFH